MQRVAFFVQALASRDPVAKQQAVKPPKEWPLAILAARHWQEIASAAAGPGPTHLISMAASLLPGEWTSVAEGF